ncbi:ABC transporter substrate-binding protein [Alicyclobacillus ferrooxydans]|uniref:ABC transporter substrate-binding protein n=1 Tax=Alicyclobacillus ferrooxydans TaxID=471514 RepID=A0A0P9EES8_9BACL|nr:ABC transporter substrate-binding protein [Alicyclobacillus ferrooxydans]KPV40846.1 ABC transporter substrate-binding protein [Alicyclobacillus ferrooxydans]
MKVVKSSSLILSVLTMTALLAGCGNSTGSSNNTTTGTNTATTTSTGMGKPLVGGAPNGNWQENFNPFSTAALYGTNGLIYQPLFMFSTVSHDIYPALGTKYQWINNNKTLEVTLRQGVKWSDGQPFTANDVLFTFNELKKYPDADTSGIMKVVTSVVKKSNYVVDFNFAAPNIPFQEYVLQASIVPQHIWQNLGDPTKVNVTNPIGTGPYTLESFTPQVFKLKLNPNFYDVKSYHVPEIDFNAYNSNQSAQLALVSGQLDWAGMFIPNVQQVYASKNPNFHYWFPAGSAIMLYPNLKNPILADLNVRKAINLAIDRNQIATQAEYGYVAPLNPTGVQPRDKNLIAPQYANLTYKQNLTQAAQILANAGYKKGSDGILVSPSGKKLSFTIQVVSGWSDWVQTCQLISQDLAKIGIQVQVQQLQFGAYQSNLQNHNFDLAIGWTNTAATSYKTFYDMLDTHGAWNPEGWSSPTTDAAFNLYKGTTDLNTQKQAMATIEGVMINQLPVMPLFYGETWYEYSTKDYTGWPDANHPYDSPAIFTWPSAAYVLSQLKPVN